MTDTDTERLVFAVRDVLKGHTYDYSVLCLAGESDEKIARVIAKQRVIRRIQEFLNGIESEAPARPSDLIT